MDELMEVENKLSVQEDDGVVYYGKVLSLDRTSPHIDFNGILNKVFQYVNMAEVVHNVKKGIEYVVRIPSEYQSGMDAGQFTMMENAKTGIMWPSLMEVGADGRKKIVTPLPIQKQEFIEGNPFRELSEGYHNLYMQRQVHELAQQLETTVHTVKRIEQGQKGDRVGLLTSGRQQILLALNQKDDESRKHALQLGAHDVFVAQGQIAEVLQTRAQDFEPLPKSSAGRFLRLMGNSDYLRNKDAEYQEIQDYYELYLQATKMLATTYTIMGDDANAEMVFNLSMDKMREIDFSKVKTIEYIHKKSDFESLPAHAVEYLDNEKYFCLEDAKQYDCLEIRVSGDMLLEGISDEREKEISEQKT